VSYILLVQLILISPSPSILVVPTVSLITYTFALMKLVTHRFLSVISYLRTIDSVQDTVYDISVKNNIRFAHEFVCFFVSFFSTFSFTDCVSSAV